MGEAAIIGRRASWLFRMSQRGTPPTNFLPRKLDGRGRDAVGEQCPGHLVVSSRPDAKLGILAPPSAGPYIQRHAVASVCGPIPPPSAAGRFHRTLSAYSRLSAQPTGLGWLHEMKHDGFRILARKQRGAEPLWAVLRAPRPPGRLADRFSGDSRHDPNRAHCLLGADGLRDQGRSRDCNASDARVPPGTLCGVVPDQNA
jgi:hypothetical protein